MQLTRTFLTILFAFISLCSCNDLSENEKEPNKTKVVPLNTINKNLLVLKPNTGQWYYNDEPFNGYGILFFENKNVAEKIGYIDGKREGKFFSFFRNGNLKKEGNYINNKLHGKKINYYENGKIYSESNYENGVLHGIQSTWFINGQLSKRRTLNYGQEEGLQQAWLEDGRLYVNYEAKDGRIYGMRRANSCYQLKDEVVTKKKKSI